ncbi:MAG TPA: class I SAM-dependent methyltransferase [Bryobacteraceae bacterium]|jgi:SAM-dependent methyltransferase
MFADAEAYQRFMGRWSSLVAPRLLDFADVPDRSRVVLDAGAGTGSLAFAIAERSGQARIVGIDPSKEYVAYASAKNLFPNRVNFEVGDAQQLRFADSSFEATVSLLVFNFIPDAAKALRELRRVTKPGGSISAAVWDYGSGMRMLRIFWDAAIAIDSAAEKLDEKRMPLCRAGQLSDLWRQGGLEDVKERPIDVVMRFESLADYWEPFMAGQGPAGAYAHSLSRVKLEALREEIKRRIPTPRDDGSFDLPARAWAVRGLVPDRR